MNTTQKYTIDLQNGKNYYVTGELADAQIVAEAKAEYTKESILVRDESGLAICYMPYYNFPASGPNAAEVFVDFGDLGYYAPWVFVDYDN